MCAIYTVTPDSANNRALHAMCRWLLLTEKDDEAKQVITKIYPMTKCSEEKRQLHTFSLRSRNQSKGLIRNTPGRLSLKT